MILILVCSPLLALFPLPFIRYFYFSLSSSLWQAVAVVVSISHYLHSWGIDLSEPMLCEDSYLWANIRSFVWIYCCTIFRSCKSKLSSYLICIFESLTWQLRHFECFIYMIDNASSLTCACSYSFCSSSYWHANSNFYPLGIFSTLIPIPYCLLAWVFRNLIHYSSNLWLSCINFWLTLCSSYTVLYRWCYRLWWISYWLSTFARHII